MLIENLKKHFQDALVMSSSPSNQHNYIWFLTNTGEKVGILKEHLTAKDIEIISLFMTPYEKKLYEMNDEQHYWYNLLYHQHQTLKTTSDNQIRFIHFYIKSKQFDQTHFEEAVTALFPTSIVILWKNEHEGTIIEKQTDLTEEKVYFEDIIDTLSTDFFLNISLFIGQINHSQTNLQKQFNWEIEAFHKSMEAIQTKQCYRIQDILPYIFLEEISSHLKDQALASIFHNILDDKELIHTIKIFIECNLNVSSAAKKLYMHRNSLHYRIDKFIEKTEINIKEFKEAMIVYLMILYYEYSYPLS